MDSGSTTRRELEHSGSLVDELERMGVAGLPTPRVRDRDGLVIT